MKSNLLPITKILPVAILLCTARPAVALWSVADVTANGTYGITRITVKITDIDKFKEFEVTFAPTTKEFPAYLDGRLNLLSKNEAVALVSVSGNREKGMVTYQFRITPETIEKSTFDIYSKGKKLARGGVIYSVKLKSFASTPAH